MPRIKIIEAIRIINEREAEAKKDATKEIQESKRQDDFKNEKTFWEKRDAEQKVKEAKRRTKLTRRKLGLPPDAKAEFIEKTCSCGRKFKVLTYHKGIRRRRCRVCKPY